ncbi:MAG: hypothetical protein P8X96_20635 [Desulfobacteraceae bacterium]
MGRENKMAIAKQVLAESVGAMVNSLEFAFIWEYADKSPIFSHCCGRYLPKSPPIQATRFADGR